MSFIQREIERLEKVIDKYLEQVGLPIGQQNATLVQAYAARQALGWALDPHNYRSPYSMITDADSESEFSVCGMGKIKPE